MTGQNMRIGPKLILVLTGLFVIGIAVFLLLALTLDFSWNRAADAEIPVGNGKGNVKLFLGSASLVRGTNVMRADLLEEAAGLVSSRSSETRNILFIVPGEKAARWLLPDNDHIITEDSNITDGNDPDTGRTIATVVLVKSPADDYKTATGKLLLFDPPGKKVVEVADNVRQTHVEALDGGDINILYERDRTLFLVTFEAQSFTKKREEQIEVPQLK